MEASSLEQHYVQKSEIPSKIGPPYLAVGLIAGILLFVELLYFQVECYINHYLQANQVIAVALLGISIGGIAAAFAPTSWRNRLCLISAGLMPVAILIPLFVSMKLPAQVWIHELLLILPFFFGSMVLSTQIASHPSHRIYFADLLGAGLGVFVFTLLLPPFLEEGSFFFAAGMAWLAAILFLLRQKDDFSNRAYKGLFVLLAVCALSAFVILAINTQIYFINMATDAVYNKDAPLKAYAKYDRWEKKKKKLEKKKEKFPWRIPEWEVSKGSLIERIDVFRGFKHGKKAGRLYTAYNGYVNDHMSRSPAKNFILNVRNPAGLYNNPSVLIIGTAAEGATKVMRAASPKGRIVGLEINPPLVDLMEKKYYNYTRGAIKDIEMHTIDARCFFKRTDEKFDIITALNTHRIRTIGAIGPPEYLHTKEALRAVFNHLTDRGYINLEERELVDRAKFGIARFLITARHVLEKDFGAKNFDDHVVVYHWRGQPKKTGDLYTSLLIKKTPWTKEQRAYLDQWRNQQVPHKKDGKLRRKRPRRFFDWLAFPGRGPDPKEKNNIYNQVIRAADPSRVLSQAEYNMDIITDDRPFPYDIYKTRKANKKILARTGLYSLVLVLLPGVVFIGVSCGRRKENGLAGLLVSLLYFELLGLAYLMIEIVLMQRFQIYLNSPIYAIAAVLGTMLVSSGLGSLYAGRLQNRGLIFAFCMIFVMLAIMAFVAPYLIEATIQLPLLLRVFITLILTGVLGFFMGMPFPVGLNRMKGRWSDRMAAFAFGINGAFGAFATPLALLTSKMYNFTTTFYIGALFYLAALLVFGLLILTKKAPCQDIPGVGIEKA